jgi:hypothetical protein
MSTVCEKPATHVVNQVKFNTKTLILTICPSTFTCNTAANMGSEICTAHMLIQILRFVTLSGRVTVGNLPNSHKEAEDLDN